MPKSRAATTHVHSKSQLQQPGAPQLHRVHTRRNRNHWFNLTTKHFFSTPCSKCSRLPRDPARCITVETCPKFQNPQQPPPHEIYQGQVQSLLPFKVFGSSFGLASLLVTFSSPPHATLTPFLFGNGVPFVSKSASWNHLHKRFLCHPSIQPQSPPFRGASLLGGYGVGTSASTQGVTEYANRSGSGSWARVLGSHV